MEGKDLNHTVRFEASKLEQKSIKETLKKVYQALEEKDMILKIKLLDIYYQVILLTLQALIMREI